MASPERYIVLTLCILHLASVQCDRIKPKVIVVGGGAAGIAAGSRLIQNGVSDVTLLEAEDRIGGRLHTVDLDGLLVELGSRTVDVNEDDPFYKMAESTTLAVRSGLNITASDFYDMNGHMVDKQTSIDLQGVFDGILTDFEAMSNYKKSVGKLLTKRLHDNEEYDKFDANLRDRFFEWYLTEEYSNEGADIFEIPAKDYSEYWQAKGYEMMVFEGKGITALLDTLMNSSEASSLNQKILLKKEATKIQWNVNNKTEVTVSCSDGSEYTANHVILTLPLGVLKERMNTLFEPELPKSKKKAIRYMDYGTVDVIYLKFEKRWWPESGEGFSFLWNANSTEDMQRAFGSDYEKYKWITNLYGLYSLENHANVLFGYFSGKYTLEIENMSDEEVLDGCVKALKLFVGKDYNVPTPQAMARSFWYKNPHFRGASFYISKSSKEHEVGPAQLAESLYFDFNRPLVLFAGEATHSKLYGSIDGAIKSGWNAADDVLEIYDN